MVIAARNELQKEKIQKALFEKTLLNNSYQGSVRQ